MTSSNLPNPVRNGRVDFLRGVAISCVLILHFTLAYGLKNSPVGALLGAALTDAIAYNGNFGVTIFFVISGYLITATSLQRWGELRSIQPRVFYRYRIARIMPCLILVLAIIVILGCFNLPYFDNVSKHQHVPASYFFVSVASVLTFWHNVLMQTSGYVNYCIDIYWSLSVEEVFYLALPLICLFARRTGLIVAICVLLIVAGPIYRSWHTDDEIYFMYGYFACFDAIAFGCLTALLARHRLVGVQLMRPLRWLAFIALCSVYLRGIDGHEVFGFSLIAFCSATFLLASASDLRIGCANGRLSAGVRWLGRYSYEIYLFHIVVLGVMRNVLSKEQLGYEARLPWLIVFVAVSVLVAWLVGRLISDPANVAIRRRFKN